ncbi:MAG: diguanylate cyclase [Raoultibacter sp.]
MFEALSSSTDNYLFFGNLQTNEYSISPKMLQDFDLPGLSVIDLPTIWGELVDERDKGRYLESLSDMLAGENDSHDAEYQIKMRDGAFVWVHCRGKLSRDPITKEPLAFIGCVQNLEKGGQLDRTTGLLSYDHCRSDLDYLLENAVECKGGILLIGIDRFSEINATNDHLFGDAVLHHTAQDILRLLPDTATIYRFEGDQMVIIYRDATAADVSRLFEDIKSYAARPHDVNGKPYRFTISGGSTLFPDDERNATDLIKNASIALDNAKRTGRDRCVSFNAELLQSVLRQRTIRKLVRENVLAGQCSQFYLLYQPIVDAGTQETIGVEALLRFWCEEYGVLYPEEIIPILEDSDLIVQVGEEVLERVSSDCSPWIAYFESFTININISYLQLQDPDFCNMVATTLARWGLDSSHLLLDLAENRFIGDLTPISKSLQQLRTQGVKIAMDDFGTGCTSLGKLDSYDVDVLKIDPLFVESLDESGYNHDFIEAVIRLCHNIGMSVCVEGIETLADRSYIQQLEADYFQGRYLSEPLHAQDFFEQFIQCDKTAEQSLVFQKPITQKKLVGDKALLRLMMDATPLCVTLIDRDFVCIDTNREAVIQFKAKNRQYCIDHFYDFSPAYQPDGSPSFEKSHEFIKKAFEEGGCIFKWMHQTSEGDPLPTEITLVRLNYQNESVVAGYTRDLRPQLAAEQAERTASERIKMLLDASPLFVSLWNKDFENIECNQEALNLFKITDRSMYLEHFYELSPEIQPDGTKTTEKIKEVLARAFKDGRYVFQWMHCTLEGELIPSEVTLIRMLYQNEYVVAGYTRDMRPQIEAQRSAQESTRRVNAIVRALPLSSMFGCSDGDLSDCHEQTVTMVKLKDESEVKSRYYSNLLPHLQPDGRSSIEKLNEIISEVQISGQAVSEWMYQTIDGEEIPCELTMIIIRDEATDDYQIASYCRDLRELQHTLEINQKLQQLAFFDSLTGVSSRSNFMQQLENRFALIDGKTAFGLALLDFDHFKTVNDTYGHKMGDVVLKTITAYVRESLPPGCMIGRYGGDEFMIQSGTMNPGEFKAWATRILKEVEAIEIVSDEQSLHETISIGCCFWNSSCPNPERLLEQADAALYHAKDLGRNHVVVQEYPSSENAN